MEKHLPLTNTVRDKPVADPAEISFVAVKSVKPVGYEDVYNLEVPRYHNFAVNGGYIVHNCMDATRYSLERHIRGETFRIKNKR